MNNVTLSLSARAECAHDVSCILREALKSSGNVAMYISRYEMKTLMPFGDAEFHITFMAPKEMKASMHNAVKTFICIAGEQSDAHHFVQSLTFSDEFNDANDATEEGEIAVGPRVVDRLNVKTVEC